MLTIIIPVFNEAESIPLLCDQLQSVCKNDYEIIFVDDGSKDKSWQVIEALAAKDPHVKAIKFRRNYGKSPPVTLGGCPRKFCLMWRFPIVFMRVPMPS